MFRKNLVIVRAGDNSLHPQWFSEGKERNWDLIVSYFGTNPDSYRNQDALRVDCQGPKWKGILELLRSYPDILDRYEYVWLPDDDISTSCKDINNIFSEMKRYGLMVAQPSLSTDSYWSWYITLVNPFTRIRWTNFVETMVPCFHVSLLKQVVPLMEGYISGWGFDWVWPEMARWQDGNVAILDCTCVTHTRPFGGPNYRFFDGLPYDARDECGHVLRLHGIKNTETVVLRIKTRFGLNVGAQTRFGRFILASGSVWLLIKAYVARRPYRWILTKFIQPNLATPDRPTDHHSREIPDGTRAEPIKRV